MRAIKAIKNEVHMLSEITLLTGALYLKGLKESKVIYKHAFRNTLIPLVTLLAGILPTLFSGAMIIEQVFSLPGIGNLAYKAQIAGDIPIIMGYNMFLAVLSVLGTLLSDIMYVVVDPRVKLMSFAPTVENNGTQKREQKQQNN